MKKILVTGAAGFIGYHIAKRLCAEGRSVLGADNLNAYYDVALKEARLRELRKLPGFTFEKTDLADQAAVREIFLSWKPEGVVHMAAQAGVRYSIDNPQAYIESNIQGFLNVLEGCRHNGVRHLLFASSSSVYGANRKLPFSVHHNVDHPLSLYAATKKAGELMAHTYAHLYRLPCTGLRFFTVYGPWGRPDMAVYSFTQALYEGRAIDVYNHGDMLRDFTYIDDVVEALARLVDSPAAPDQNWSGERPDAAASTAPYRLYNIGNSRPERLTDLIAGLERETGMKAKMNLLPMQPGDVHATCADTADLERASGFRPATPLAEGLKKFVAWYKEYHS